MTNPDRVSRQTRAENMRESRDFAVLEAAIAEAREQGYQFITRDAVAARAGVSVGGVNNAFGTMVDLKRAVLRAAIEREILPIVAEGIAMGSPVVADLAPELRERALLSLAR
jgi:AcrR family transcriptional regulator